jgi:hypothetical protein
VIKVIKVMCECHWVNLTRINIIYNNYTYRQIEKKMLGYEYRIKSLLVCFFFSFFFRKKKHRSRGSYVGDDALALVVGPFNGNFGGVFDDGVKGTWFVVKKDGGVLVDAHQDLDSARGFEAWSLDLGG